MPKRDTKNYKAINVTPRDYQAINVKPRNKAALNINPRDRIALGETVVYTDTRTFAQGQSMGLLLTLTYPVAGTWTNAVRV